ncbi:MAG: bifunctional adenosylcobinamide kinase/adenosylcobinamide-phosphate guanylyltransferase [Velocimicrobium sp.]
MIVVIGGAYQGKLAYVKKQYCVTDADILICEQGQCEIVTSQPVIYGWEHMILAQVKCGIDSMSYVKGQIDYLQDKIIICEDSSCGIVPTDKDMRLYREASGRTLSYLASRADEVVRVFCGIGSKIK